MFIPGHFFQVTSSNLFNFTTVIQFHCQNSFESRFTGKSVHIKVICTELILRDGIVIRDDYRAIFQLTAVGDWIGCQPKVLRNVGFFGQDCIFTKNKC